MIMGLKTARLTLLIDPNKKAAFERLCARQDRTASQAVRQFIRDYLAEHGVADVASDIEAIPELSAQPTRPAPAVRKSARSGTQPAKQPTGSATRSGTRRR